MLQRYYKGRSLVTLTSILSMQKRRAAIDFDHRLVKGDNPEFTEICASYFL